MSSRDRLKPVKSKDGNDIQMYAKGASAPVPVPTTSRDLGPGTVETKQEPEETPWRTRCWKYIYDKDQKLFCGRTCKSWWYMVIYSIMYLMFLSTYTMIFLYASLTLIKMTETYNMIDKSELMTYAENGIGLTAAPSSMHSFPLIWYKNGQADDYNKYVKSLDQLLKRRKRQVDNFTDLGPCGVTPYGYGGKPCIIIRLNKQIKWSAKPFSGNVTKDIPKEVISWLKLKEQKLWLHCGGYHSYDKEHIGSINYYPYPPGFDPNLFPLDMQKEAPLIAIQISNFTVGLSLSVECKLWYDGGVSSVSFVLYVEPKNRSVRNENL